ncbi:hypothetical protein, partial [Neisseria sp. HMSC070F02]
YPKPQKNRNRTDRITAFAFQSYGVIGKTENQSCKNLFKTTEFQRIGFSPVGNDGGRFFVFSDRCPQSEILTVGTTV